MDLVKFEEANFVQIIAVIVRDSIVMTNFGSFATVAVAIPSPFVVKAEIKGVYFLGFVIE